MVTWYASKCSECGWFQAISGNLARYMCVFCKHPVKPLLYKSHCFDAWEKADGYAQFKNGLLKNNHPSLTWSRSHW